MPEIIGKLERRYGNFINEPKSWDFFIGLAEYVHYIKQTPVLMGLINQVLKQKAKDLQPIEKLSKKALAEVKAAENKLFKRLKEKKISYPELDNLIENHEGIKKGTRGGNASVDYQLYDSLAEIIRQLYFHDQGKYRQVLSGLDLILDWPKQAAIEKFRFANALDDKYYEMRILEDKKDVAIWAAWEYLHDAYLVFYKGYSHAKEREDRISPSDMKERWEDLNFGVLLLERDEIKSGKNSHAFFDMDFFRPYVKRVHSYFLDQPEKIQELVSDELGDIMLDKDIMLSMPQGIKPFLKLRALGTTKFEPRAIPKQTANIIDFLRKAIVNKRDQFSFTLEELAERLTKTEKSTGSLHNQRKRVNDLCDEFNVKQIFHTNSEGKWQLNPDLDCVKLRG